MNKTMKNTLFGFAVVLLVIAAAGCAPPTEPDEAPTTAEESKNCRVEMWAGSKNGYIIDGLRNPINLTYKEADALTTTLGRENHRVVCQ